MRANLESQKSVDIERENIFKFDSNTNKLWLRGEFTPRQLSPEEITTLGFDDLDWLRKIFAHERNGIWFTERKGRLRVQVYKSKPRRSFRPRDLQNGDIVDLVFGDWVRDESLCGAKFTQAQITQFDPPWIEINGALRINLLELESIHRRLRKRGPKFKRPRPSEGEQNA